MKLVGVNSAVEALISDAVEAISMLPYIDRNDILTIDDLKELQCKECCYYDEETKECSMGKDTSARDIYLCDWFD